MIYLLRIPCGMATDLQVFSDALSGVGCPCLGKTKQVQSGDRASGSRLPCTLRKRGLGLWAPFSSRKSSALQLLG